MSPWVSIPVSILLFSLGSQFDKYHYVVILLMEHVGLCSPSAGSTDEGRLVLPAFFIKADHLGEVDMKKIDCLSEKLSARTLGVLLLPIAVAIAFIGMLILPVVGFFFCLPLLVGSVALIFAPESKACRLITGGVNKAVADN